MGAYDLNLCINDLQTIVGLRPEAEPVRARLNLGSRNRLRHLRPATDPGGASRRAVPVPSHLRSANVLPQIGCCVGKSELVQ